jgi:RNA polymerase sigma-70 factor (ECF subfamily)
VLGIRSASVVPPVYSLTRRIPYTLLQLTSIDDDCEGYRVDRANELWIEDLKGSGEPREQALHDLGSIIRSGLPYSLSRWLTPSEPQFDALADEVVQETLLRVLDHIDSFESRSKFTTWVHKIAVRVALTELRRKRWRDVSLDELVDTSEAPSYLEILADRSRGPEQAAEQADMMGHIERLIEEELTEKQRKAMVALGVHGMAVEEVARRMGMNRNALYKLMHDARIGLKARLLTEGLSPDDILAVFEQA